MKKKILALCMVVSMLAVAIVGGTLAYFTDVKTEDNIFTLGDVEVQLWESNGEGIDNDGIQGNTDYEEWLKEQELVPGVPVEKDVWVKNVGNTPAYIRATITIPKNVTPNWDAAGWTQQSATENADGSVTYVYYYNTALDNENQEATSLLLTSVEIDKYLTEGDFDSDTLTVPVKIEAIQAKGFNTVEEAMKALDNQQLADEDATVVDSKEDLLSALENGGSIALEKNMNFTNPLEIPEGTNATINLNGKTLKAALIAPDADLTIKNGTLNNDNAEKSAVAINSGSLTLENVNVESARHAVRVEGNATVVIESGTYKVTPDSSKTLHALNVSDGGNVIINGGTFIGPKGTSADSGAAVCVQAGSTVTINGGNFSNGKNNTLSASGTLIVKGGTFDQDPSKYVAAGYTVTEKDGKYTVSATSVSDADDLKTALGNGDSVVLEDNIVVSGAVTAAPNGGNEAYGHEIGFAQYGGTIDGNGKTISGENDNEWMIITHGGTIKNLTIDSGERGIVTYSPEENIIIDNVIIDGPGYAINTAEQTEVRLIVTNSTINGWTSFAGLESASFTNCKFGENTKKYWQNMGYDQDYDRLIRPYVTTVLTDCEFEAGYYIDLSKLGTDCMVTIDNCDVNGVVVTAENYSDMITIELPSDRTLADCVIFD